MRSRLAQLRVQLALLALLVSGAGLYCLGVGDCSLLTADQRGFRAFERTRYAEAASRFADPLWRAAALYRAGEFEQAASLFAGFDTFDAAFNQGNALVMQGRYEAAAERYARALALRPGWEDARINRDIATGRAAALEQKGADMTGGRMGADDMVFEQGGTPPSAGEEQVAGAQEPSDAELRSIWLRQVETRPADFLRAKFAQQYAAGRAEGD